MIKNAAYFSVGVHRRQIFCLIRPLIRDLRHFSYATYLTGSCI